ncbi:SAM-dependent methyltransferase [Paenibacillus athensensis]|uniref:SAM-dependent methyltransferase, MidA family n=1 Tax=Paenibacillus athensensis TaxID=1967502 RepID=A0A4Y8PRC3_9BACL|nr:SAM-dependent methyltransferase [Paenibacillus athensensis]MCD1261524.1 SAM-dependent methyltransferase [Paenibacillus athensensis]
MSESAGHPAVVAAIRERMAASPDGAITFRDYMELALYHEPHGYYREERVKIGRDGDFYTSASIGTLMGELLAAHVAAYGAGGRDAASAGERDAAAHGPDAAPAPLRLVEWGGGTGRLALHLLDELRRAHPDVYAHTTYMLIESSGYHRRLQAETLHEHAALIRFADGEVWAEEPPEDHLIVIANELVDAFPVHRMRWREQRWEECAVVWDERRKAFGELWRPADDPALLAHADALGVAWREGQQAEFNLAAAEWVRRVGRRIRSGQLIVIDYGDVSAELYAAHRQLGTLMCYRRHQASADALVYAGEQDVTAHVNFSVCLAAAADAGFSPTRLQTQREFLVELGILGKLQDAHDPNPFSEKARRNRAIRQLLLSDQMSELFKVMTAYKHPASAEEEAVR